MADAQLEKVRAERQARKTGAKAWGRVVDYSKRCGGCAEYTDQPDCLLKQGECRRNGLRLANEVACKDYEPCI